MEFPVCLIYMYVALPKIVVMFCAGQYYCGRKLPSIRKLLADLLMYDARGIQHQLSHCKRFLALHQLAYHLSHKSLKWISRMPNSKYWQVKVHVSCGHQGHRHLSASPGTVLTSGRPDHRICMVLVLPCYHGDRDNTDMYWSYTLTIQTDTCTVCYMHLLKLIYILPEEHACPRGITIHACIKTETALQCLY